MVGPSTRRSPTPPLPAPDSTLYPSKGAIDDTTVDVEGAALLLHTTAEGIYSRRARGQLPPPLCRKPLVCRKADLLDLAQSRASSPERSRR